MLPRLFSDLTGKTMTTSLLSKRLFAVVLPALCFHAICSAASLAGDFSASTNPSGDWSYGWSTATGSAFNLDTTTTVASNLIVWKGIPANDAFGNPSILFNPTNSPISFGADTIFNAKEVSMHPGPAGQNAVARWTASATGMFHIATSFQGRSSITGTTTDVHVLLNSIALFDGSVTGFGPGSGPSFAGTISVVKGDKVDFTVGFGNGNYYFDSTQVVATISAVPEPATLTMFLLGAALFSGAQIRRRGRGTTGPRI
jgi:hypothetical protein